MSQDNDKMCRPCAICGETRPESFKIWFDGYVKLYKCRACGFVSQFPGPGKSTVVTDYQDSYSLSFLNDGHEFMYPHRRCVLQDIATRIAARKEGASILDVGCGDGHFLYLCSQMGFKCSGVEDSNALSQYASQKTGAHVLQGMYSKEMFSAGSFDVITFIQVLEHIPDPIQALETAYYHLREDGILVVEVPSIHSPHFLAYQLTGIKRFVQAPRGVVYCHFGYFAPKPLVTLTEKCGFRRLSVVTGRWQYKYPGFLKPVGKALDPVLNAMRVGGILYTGAKKPFQGRGNGDLRDPPMPGADPAVGVCAGERIR